MTPTRKKIKVRIDAKSMLHCLIYIIIFICTKLSDKVSELNQENIQSSNHIIIIIRTTKNILGNFFWNQ